MFVVNSPEPATDSYINPNLAQQDVNTIGGFDDGTYEVQVTGPEGVFTFSFVAAGSSIALIAAGLAAAAEANGPLNDIMESVATATTHNMNFRARGVAYDVVFLQNPNTNMVLTQAQAPGGDSITPGLWLVQGAADNEAGAPVGSSVAQDVVGISVLNEANQINDGDPASTDDTLPGKILSAVRRGWVYCLVEDAVVKGAPVFCRMTATGTQIAGASRSDDDGGAAVVLPGVSFGHSANAGGLASVKVNRP